MYLFLKQTICLNKNVFMWNLRFRKQPSTWMTFLTHPLAPALVLGPANTFFLHAGHE